MNVATVTLVAASLDDPAQLCDEFGDAQAFEGSKTSTVSYTTW